MSAFSTDYYRVAYEEEEIQTNENFQDELGEEAEELPDVNQDLEAQLAHVRQRLGNILEEQQQTRQKTDRHTKYQDEVRKLVDELQVEDAKEDDDIRESRLLDPVTLTMLPSKEKR
jgi:predicted nuclease with TOPRIM domain